MFSVLHRLMFLDSLVLCFFYIDWCSWILWCCVFSTQIDVPGFFGVVVFLHRLMFLDSLVLCFFYIDWCSWILWCCVFSTQIDVLRFTYFFRGCNYIFTLIGILNVLYFMSFSKCKYSTMCWNIYAFMQVQFYRIYINLATIFDKYKCKYRAIKQRSRYDKGRNWPKK
jgi:hypothetical protein